MRFRVDAGKGARFELETLTADPAQLERFFAKQRDGLRAIRQRHLWRMGTTLLMSILSFTTGLLWLGPTALVLVVLGVILGFCVREIWEHRRPSESEELARAFCEAVREQGRTSSTSESDSTESTSVRG